MKKYYIRYWNNFANTYSLCYTSTPDEDAAALASGWERITRKQAEAKCREELERRKYDQSFSGFAPATILPWDYPTDSEDPRNDRKLALRGYVWERI